MIKYSKETLTADRRTGEYRKTEYIFLVYKNLSSVWSFFDILIGLMNQIFIYVESQSFQSEQESTLQRDSAPE